MKHTQIRDCCLSLGSGKPISVGVGWGGVGWAGGTSDTTRGAALGKGALVTEPIQTAVLSEGWRWLGNMSWRRNNYLMFTFICKRAFLQAPPPKKSPLEDVGLASGVHWPTTPCPPLPPVSSGWGIHFLSQKWPKKKRVPAYRQGCCLEGRVFTALVLLQHVITSAKSEGQSEIQHIRELNPNSKCIGKFLSCVHHTPTSAAIFSCCVTVLPKSRKPGSWTE